MLRDRNPEGGAPRAIAPAYIDGMLYNGVDPAAARRTHGRELTTARQLAERHRARPGEAGADRAAEFLAEMARIDALHRAWLLEHGVGVVARRTRVGRPPAQAVSATRTAQGCGDPARPAAGVVAGRVAEGLAARGGQGAADAAGMADPR